jgi:hypothetical protein
VKILQSAYLTYSAQAPACRNGLPYIAEAMERQFRQGGSLNFLMILFIKIYKIFQIPKNQNTKPSSSKV